MQDFVKKFGKNSKFLAIYKILAGEIQHLNHQNWQVSLGSFLWYQGDNL